MTGAERLQWCSAHCTGEFHEKQCPIAKLLREEWCTPREITDRLPTFDLDPCSNERSTVPAKRRCLGEYDWDDGLRVSWVNLSVFANPPYSCVRPFAAKASEETDSFVFLVNLCPDTKWWKTLREAGGRHVLMFDRRLQFAPPPRIKQSTNQRPSCLVASSNGRDHLDGALDDLGTWYASGTW